MYYASLLSKTKFIREVGSHALNRLRETAQPAMKVEIHNKCSHIELVDPLYFSDGAICLIPLDQKVAPGGTLDTAFKIDLTRMDFEGALIYRLRKKGINSGQQSNADTKNIDRNWSSYVWLLVGWRMERFNNPRVYMLLVEHGEEFVWGEDMLFYRHKKFRRLLNVDNGSVTSTWLMEDDYVLRLALDSVGNKKYGIRITIFDGVKDDYAEVPLPIESKR
jgi:hypothetical protein